jgi:hypothetical protein
MTDDKLHPMQVWIKSDLENVSKMKKQLTYEQCERLIDEFGDKKEIARVLMQMENFAQLTKKYRSVYLTVKNWIEINRARAPKGSSFQQRYTHSEMLNYLEKQGIPFSDESKHFSVKKEPDGKAYWIRR